MDIFCKARYSNGLRNIYIDESVISPLYVRILQNEYALQLASMLRLDKMSIPSNVILLDHSALLYARADWKREPFNQCHISMMPKETDKKPLISHWKTLVCLSGCNARTRNGNAKTSRIL